MNRILLFLMFTVCLCGTLAAQDIVIREGRYLVKSTGKPFSGIYKEYDDDARIVSEANVKEGLPDGVTTLYYPTGRTRETRNYINGLKDGTWLTWNEKGVKTAEANFKGGKKSGAWYVWDDEGVKRYDMFYQDGVKKGTWIIYDAGGRETSREEYK